MSSVSDLLLPPGTRMIHIGPSKTGSTAIQNAMLTHRDTLREHGVVYASGGGTRAREAGWAVVGGGSPVGRRRPRMEKWHELVREVEAAGDLRVAHSNEEYGRATPEEVATIVAGVGGGRPHVVSVVRRLDGLFPSYWQERVKARETRPYEEWLKVVLAEESDTWQWTNVNHPHDVRGVVERWGREVGEENITLIVSDSRDRSLLPTSFELLLGLPAGTLRVDDSKSNRSLSLEETEVVRAVNKIFRRQEWPDRDYARLVQAGLVRGLRSQPVPEGHHKLPLLPAWAQERVAELSARQADAVRDCGARVIGDPDTLRVDAEPSSAPTSGAPWIDVDSAARMAEGMIAASQRLRQRDRRRVRNKSRGRRTARAAGPLVQDTASRELLKVVARRLGSRLTRQ